MATSVPTPPAVPGIAASALGRPSGKQAFSLVELSLPELEALAASRVPASFAARLEEGALPPAFVAARSLANRASGQPSPWSTTFLIERVADGRLVGGCGFKRAPCQGQVEVG